jgi:sec-independent protein translocase protein TatC
MGVKDDGKDIYVDEERPIKEHIIELSIRLRRIFLAMLIAAGVLSFIPIDKQGYVPLVAYFPHLLINHALPKQITWRGHVYNVAITQHSPFSGFNLIIESALLLGLIGASPVIVKEIYEYVAPALYPHEKRTLKSLSAVGILSFVGGVLFAYYIVVPWAFKIMFITTAAISGSKLIAFADVEKLFNTIVLLALATGASFEIPLIIYLLISAGIIDEKYFQGENLKFIFFAAMVVGAIISPDPSGLGMVAIGSAMFGAIVLAARLGAKAKKARELKERETKEREEIVTEVT